MNDVCLLVTVRTRRDNIPKLCGYYKDFPCRKILSDNYDTPYEDIELIKECGFEYIHSDPSKWWWDILADISLSIEQKYMIQVADDDRILKSGLIKSLDLLRQNEDMVTCDGGQLGFNVAHNPDISRVTVKNLGSGSYYKQNTMNPDSRQRLINFYFHNYYDIIHSVHKTEVHARVYDFLRSSGARKSLNAEGNFFTIMALDAGKKGSVAPYAMLVRNTNTKDREIEMGHERKLYELLGWNLDSEFTEKKQNLVELSEIVLKDTLLLDKDQNTVDKIDFLHGLTTAYIKFWRRDIHSKRFTPCPDRRLDFNEYMHESQVTEISNCIRNMK
jgi:hypothetical protein